MRILGIETSCDETAVCIIEAEGSFESDFKFQVIGNSLLSQIATHAPYGGVFPNLAKREHAKNLVPVMTEALQRASLLKINDILIHTELSLISITEILSREMELYTQLVDFLLTYSKPDIDAIAVTNGPGLEPALWVGVNFARALSTIWNIPLIAVNHMEGHIILSLANVTDAKHSHILENVRMSGRLEKFKFPLLALLISGGHTELVLSRDWMQYELVGRARDDAVGEAFDKVARLLDLPYPGGPEVSRLAEEARSGGDASELREATPPKVILPRPMMHENNLDFSFAGLKTAVRRLVEEKAPLSPELKKEIAREFEDAAADVLIAKTLRAIEEFNIETVVVGGGVSANTHIRRRLAQSLEDYGSPAKLLIPRPELATDNAIMIALAGYFRAQRNHFADPALLRADGNLKLA